MIQVEGKDQTQTVDPTHADTHIDEVDEADGKIEKDDKDDKDSDNAKEESEEELTEYDEFGCYRFPSIARSSRYQSCSRLCS